MNYAVSISDKETGYQDFLKFEGGSRLTENLEHACKMADELYGMFSSVYNYTVVSITPLYITE